MVALRTQPEGAVTPIYREPLMLKPPVHLYIAYGCAGEQLVVDEITGRLIDRNPFVIEPEEGDIAQPIP